MTGKGDERAVLVPVGSGNADEGRSAGFQPVIPPAAAGLGEGEAFLRRDTSI